VWIIILNTLVTAFWNIVLCSFVEVDWCFRGVYCLHHQGNDWVTSETSVCFNKTTQCYVPEGCHLQSCCCEKLKSHIVCVCVYIELNWIYLHSINPKQVNTFGYRTSQHIYIYTHTHIYIHIHIYIYIYTHTYTYTYTYTLLFRWAAKEDWSKYWWAWKWIFCVWCQWESWVQSEKIWSFGWGKCLTTENMISHV
jgi:hypothetical protein